MSMNRIGLRKGKHFPVHPMKTYGETRGAAPLILNLDIEGQLYAVLLTPAPVE
jgi:hypothetical protein